MWNLKRKMMKKNKLILLLIILIITTVTKGYSQPTIERVKNDLIAYQDSILMPVEAISALWERSVNYIEFKEYYLVHAINKNWVYEPALELSAVLIYKKIDDKLKLVNVVPFYTDLKLLDEKKSLFISDNFLCDMGGRCKSLVSVLKFTGNNLVELTSHSGFSNTFYMENCISEDKTQTLDKHINDTIAESVTLENIQYNGNGKLEYKLITEKTILEGYSDTLYLQTMKSQESIIK
jgi:hypothetical protein